VHNGVSWLGDWTRIGGQFQSQPESVIWGLATRINVLGIASTGGTVASKALRDGAWEPEWRSVEAIGTSRVSACYVRWDNGDHVDIFVRGPGSSTKSMMSTALRGEGDPNWSTESGKFYDDWGTWSKGGNLGSEISIVCRKSDLAQDMVMYQAGTRSVAHMQWVNGIGLTGWKDLGGDFAGAPVLVALSSSPRVDFFGTGRDRRVYHFSWAQGANYSALESIGGDFESVPAVVVTSSSRLDLLAVGTDDKLKHRAYIGGKWANDWEDLGVSPTARRTRPSWAPRLPGSGYLCWERTVTFSLGRGTSPTMRTGRHYQSLRA